MEIKQLRITTDKITSAQEQFITNVINKHNLTPEQAEVKFSPHNNKVDVYYKGIILGRWMTELEFKSDEDSILITYHEWY